MGLSRELGRSMVYNNHSHNTRYNEEAAATAMPDPVDSTILRYGRDGSDLGLSIGSMTLGYPGLGDTKGSRTSAVSSAFEQFLSTVIMSQ